MNLNKLAVYFSHNFEEERKRAICSELQVASKEAKFMYLGIPVGVGLKKKKKVFTYAGNRIWNRLQSWQDRAFSKAGNELLIKSVTKSILNYVMGFCLLPEEFYQRIERMLNAF